MKLLKGFIAITVLSVATFGNAMAQDNATSIKVYEKADFTGGLGVSYLLFDKKAAAEQNIGDSAFSIDLFGSYYISPKMSATAGFGFVTLDDEAEFDQAVVNQNTGERLTASSTASAINFYAELMYLLEPVTIASRDVQIRVGPGYSGIGNADRKIENCSDCRKVDIELDGGVYVTGGVFREGWDESSSIGLSAKQYVSGDLKTAASLWVEYKF